MYLRQRLPIHLPRQQYLLIHLHLPPWDRDGVVVDLAFLEICICADEFEMFRVGEDAAARDFEDLFEGNTTVDCRTAASERV